MIKVFDKKIVGSQKDRVGVHCVVERQTIFWPHPRAEEGASVHVAGYQLPRLTGNEEEVVPLRVTRMLIAWTRRTVASVTVLHFEFW